MPRFFSLALFFLAFAIPAQLFAADTSWVAVPFYSEIIRLPQLGPSTTERIVPIREEKLVRWYRWAQNSDQYRILLHSLVANKTRLQLNDWLYYELIRESVQKLLADADLQEQVLLCWYLLSESNYDTRITFLDDQIFVYAYTNESIFDTPVIIDNGRKYVNLTSIHQKMRNPSVSLSMLPFDARPQGKNFSFRLDSWPLLSAQVKEFPVNFSWRQQNFSFQLAIDETIANLMHQYPVFEEFLYLEVPFSKTLAQSLLPQFQEILAGKDKKEALEILAVFTRSSFAYKEDHDQFGKNKPMIADELFHYRYSDCEDRSALYFNLVRSLLDLPMIAIAYPDHLTIAVALDQVIGPSIQYEGKSYYICDPTGPGQSGEIGQIPVGYEEISFQILGKYK